MKTRITTVVLGLFLGFAALPATAAQFKEFGNYTVHYNAVTTDMLPAPVASAYNIRRSSNIALLNVTVLKDTGDKATKPVAADVEASAVNLTNQYHSIEMRKVKEGEAIYYLGTLGVDNSETFEFTIIVSPKGIEREFVVQFQQQFFTE